MNSDETDPLFMRVSDVRPREGLPWRITRLSYSSNIILREGKNPVRVIHNSARASGREGLPSPARVTHGRRAESCSAFTTAMKCVFHCM